MADGTGEGQGKGRPNERARERRRLLERAQWLRHHPTDAELRLWYRIRGRQLDGYKFRRQVMVAGYVVDFACLQARLIIEVDGEQHGEPEQREWDRLRTERLTAAGFHVMRFWNFEVLQQTDGVLEAIVRELHRLTKLQGDPKP